MLNVMTNRMPYSHVISRLLSGTSFCYTCTLPTCLISLMAHRSAICKALWKESNGRILISVNSTATLLVRCILADVGFWTGLLAKGVRTRASELLPHAVESGASSGGIDDDINDDVGDTHQEECAPLFGGRYSLHSAAPADATYVGYFCIMRGEDISSGCI